MSRARFAFAAHPDAIADLRELAPEIRDLALLELQTWSAEATTACR